MCLQHFPLKRKEKPTLNDLNLPKPTEPKPALNDLEKPTLNDLNLPKPTEPKPALNDLEKPTLNDQLEPDN